MDSALIWYALWLVLFATIFWAAVWFWLPALFRGRERRHPPPGHDERENTRRHGSRGSSPGS